MLDFIKNLLPRLRQYSKDLDKIENFVDKKWRFVDIKNESMTFLFLRDGRLIISKVTNGTDQETIEGSWELLPTNQLLLKRPEPILLEQGFIGDAILILQLSDTSNPAFCCYDPRKISDTKNIEIYLNSFLKSGIPEPSLPRAISYQTSLYAFPEPPSEILKELTLSTNTLKYMLRNYRTYIQFYWNEMAPLYVAAELIRREKKIDSDLVSYVDMFARDCGFADFDTMIEQYKV
jgi:hypothetical protein